MSLVANKAKELAQTLNKSSEYQAFIQAKAKIDKSAEAKKQLTAFRNKQYNAQRDMAAGKKDEKKLKELELIHQSMLSNKVLKEFLDAEYNFTKMLYEVQKIIGEAVGLSGKD